MLFKTPEVLALETRIKELERENMILRDQVGMYPTIKMFSTIEDEQINRVDISCREVRLPLAAAWCVSRSWMTGEMHAVGWCDTDGGDRLSVQYYHPDPKKFSRHIAITVLGGLHERAVRQLASLWWPAKSTP